MTKQVQVSRTQNHCEDDTTTDVYELKNSSDSVVDTHLLVIVRGLPSRVELDAASGVTHDGVPYIRVFLEDGVLQPGQVITQRLVLRDPEGRPLPSYSLQLLSGQGEP